MFVCGGDLLERWVPVQCLAVVVCINIYIWGNRSLIHLSICDCASANGLGPLRILKDYKIKLDLILLV